MECMRLGWALVIVTVGLALLYGRSVAQSGEKLRIGFIAPFSGPAQAYGASARSGFELALGEIGDRRIEVFYEDDQFTAAKTVSAFKKLTDLNHVHVVISVGSTPSNAIAPLAENRKVPLIAWASDSRVSKGRSYVMRSYPSGESEGQEIAQQAVKLGYADIGVFTVISDYASSVRSGFQSRSGSGTVKLDVEVPVETSDFRPFLIQAQQKGVKQLFLCLNPGQFGLLARQARELKLQGAIFGCENLHASNEISLSAGALEGAWFVTTRVDPDFEKKYREKLGEDAFAQAVTVHYDLAYLLHDALNRARHAAGVFTALLGASRRNVALGSRGVVAGAGDRYIDAAWVVMQVRGETFVPLR